MIYAKNPFFVEKDLAKLIFEGHSILEHEIQAEFGMLFSSGVKQGEITKDSAEFRVSYSEWRSSKNGGSRIVEELVNEKFIASKLNKSVIEWYENGQLLLLTYHSSVPYAKFMLPYNNLKIEQFYDQTVYETLKIYLDSINASLEVLFDLHKDVMQYCKSPLMYDKERSKLIYYDSECKFEADSNPAKLCEKIFEYPTGYEVEKLELAMHIFGCDELGFSSQLKTKLTNAIEYLNKKTKKKLNISTLSTTPKTVSLRSFIT